MTLGERFGWRGREVAWTRFGDGPPVVFCHGTPFSSIVWRPYAEALARDHTVHLWDMPGYGASSMHPDHAVDFDAHGRLLADLIGHWGLERPRRGRPRLRRRRRAPRATSSTTWPTARCCSSTSSRCRRPARRSSASSRRTRACSTTCPPPSTTRWSRAYIQGASHRGLRPEDLDALKAPWLTAGGQGAFYRQIAQTDERYLAEIEERLGGVAIPVRVLWGGDDAWITPGTGRRLAGLIPGASFALVPGAGHLMHYDAPVALASELRAWLSRR